MTPDYAGLTPEQIAEKIINDNCDWVHMKRGALYNLAGDIIDAIRAAAQDAARRERERCARVATGNGLATSREQDLRGDIADAIRALPDEA